MRQVLITLLSIAIAIFVPAILVVNAIRVLANDWYIHFEYARPDFPPDAYGLNQEQRTELALTGLHSVLPQYGEGIELLRQARLPDGSEAFNARELGHMADVRVLIGQIYPLHLFTLVALIALAIVLGRAEETRAIIPRALQWGSLLTLVIAAGLIAYILINFDTFFVQFHRIFFEGETWLFQFTDTLIRLYPVKFWSDIAILIGAATVVQALVLLAGTWWWLRMVR
ncbi:MAG TPA: TIGR01906 family membrane protein [Anaerolineae bacterium]|nr:TIGR01906 family membrane protein [Anaerolineae bacterium]